MDMKTRSAEPSRIGSASADARLMSTRSLDGLLRAALTICKDGSMPMPRANRSANGWVKRPVPQLSKMTCGAGGACAATRLSHSLSTSGE